MTTLFLPGRGGRKQQKPETAWKADIIAYLKIRYRSIWILPVRGGIGQRAGVPDLLCVINGRLLGIEAKAPGRPSPLSPRQREEINAIREAGGIAGRVASWDELDELLKELENPPCLFPVTCAPNVGK